MRTGSRLQLKKAHLKALKLQFSTGKDSSTNLFKAARPRILRAFPGLESCPTPGTSTLGAQ